MLREKGSPLFGHGGVNDRLKPGERGGIPENQRAKGLAPYAARIRAARKGSLDGRHQRTAGALKTPHFGIGVEHRHARRREHRRDGRFAHPDRSGQAENEGLLYHPVSRARSSLSCSRGAGIPKNFSNASAACPMSIASPSMVPNPAARAFFRNAVSTGSVTMS